MFQDPRPTRFNAPRWSIEALLLGAGFAALISCTANAATVTVKEGKDFSLNPLSFTLESSSITFTNVSTTSDPLLFAAVGVTTTGDARVYSSGGVPQSYGYPNPVGNSQSFGPGPGFESYSTATPVPYTLGQSSVIGLSDTLAGLTYYGYAVFDGTNIRSFTFESTPGTAIFLPVPLPASAPMFGAALVALASVGYAMGRTKTVHAS